MNYKCPLCLKELDETEFLVRFCSKCNKHSVISGNTSSIEGSLRCEDDSCLAYKQIENGIYFSHLECSSTSPYYRTPTKLISAKGIDNKNGAFVEVDVPSQDITVGVSPPSKIGNNNVTFRGDKVFIDDDILGRREFSQWQIGLLNKVPNQITFQKPVEKEKIKVMETQEQWVTGMWFPLMLLRATTESVTITEGEERKQKRIGASIALIGERAIGKTILAFQSLDRDSYLDENSPDELKIFDYLHYSHNESFYSALELRFFMRRNTKTIFRFDGTPADSRNIHAVFFEPQNQHNSSVDSEIIIQSKNPEKKIKLWQKLSQVPKRIKKWLFDSASLEASSFYYTLSFYDLAGEDADAMTEQIKETSQKVDKLGVLVNSKTLIDSQSSEDLGIALDALRAGINIEYCIVFTHLDELLQKLAENSDQSILNDIENSELRQHFIRGKQELQRRFLSELIKKYPSPLKNELLSYIKNNPVFFIGHENLPTRLKNQPALPEENLNGIKQPYSVGLIPFICWCLDLQWEEICNVGSE